MKPKDLQSTNLVSTLAGSKVVYFDGRMLDTAIFIAQEAFQLNIPILVDAEKPRVGLDGLLRLTDYIICSENFPQPLPNDFVTVTQPPPITALLNSFAAFFTTAGITAAKRKIRWRCILQRVKNCR
ncbi:hypothetical protein PIB30_055913 [Stylosanthes scabra]|uniref:Uncharacterized protein n=1 Tax=Stylosanthes scabra TaxID=79078 RepID=A0ABU6TLN3_9FABA|nr:hypothetical protein [Stylosanthes scabra]